MKPHHVISLFYVLAITFFIYAPIATLVFYSFQDGSVPLPPFRGFSLRWYEAVLNDDKMITSLWNSTIVALVSSVIATALAFMAAYGLSRHTYRFSRLIQWLLIAPITVSYLVLALGLMLMFNYLGMTRSLFLVVIGHVVINLPLCFGILYSQMGRHLVRYELAARDLGANAIQTMILITAPMILPAVLAAFALAVTFSWDEFIIAYLLTRFDVTLPVEIWGMMRRGLNPTTNAVGTLVFAISVILVLIGEYINYRRAKT